MARWLTFDCYGTLVDWRTGIAQGIEAVAPGQSGRLLPLYYRQEAAGQAEGVRSNRGVLGAAVHRAGALATGTVGPEVGRGLPNRRPLKPFLSTGPPGFSLLLD